MTNIKTAISIEKPLFEEMDALAEEMEVSRSYLFRMAAREFIQNRNNQKLLEAINAACKAPPSFMENRLRAQMKSKHRQLVKNQR